VVTKRKRKVIFEFFLKTKNNSEIHDFHTIGLNAAIQSICIPLYKELYNGFKHGMHNFDVLAVRNKTNK